MVICHGVTTPPYFLLIVLEPNVQYFFEMQASNVEIDLLSVGTQQEFFLCCSALQPQNLTTRKCL